MYQFVRESDFAWTQDFIHTCS